MPNYSDGEPDAPAIASSDVLSRRKILKPKGRLGSNTTGASSNAFGALTSHRNLYFPLVVVETMLHRE